MAVSDELRQHLMDVAEENGVDPEELIAQFESDVVAGQGGDTPPKPEDPAPKAEVPACMYPFLTVNQVLAAHGLELAKVDGDLYTGQWLAKYGGAEFLSAK